MSYTNGVFMFEVWLSGFLVCLGVWFVWRKEWKVEGESKFKYIIRVLATCATSWFSVGIILGRMTENLKELHKSVNK